MQIIRDYLKLKRSDRTKKLTTICIRRFVNWKYDATAKTIEETEQLAEKYLSEFKFQDILDYTIYLRDEENKSPKTISSYVGMITFFYEYYDKTLTKSQKQTIQSVMPRSIAVTRDKAFTKKTIAGLYKHSDVLLGAIILLMSSSGMRINEVLTLEWDEIEFGSPNKIYMPREKMKQGRPHTYRFSSEAADALREWEKARDTYEDDGIRRSRTLLGIAKTKNSSVVFPIGKSSFYIRWKNVISSAKMDGKDTTTNRFVYSSHGFRRWFSSTASKFVPHEIVEALIGHDTGLSSSYRRYPEEGLDEIYLKLEPHILINAPDDFSDLKGRMSESLKEQQQATAQLAVELMRLREKTDMLETFLKVSQK